MELRKRFDLRMIVTILYVVFACAYLAVGFVIDLTPADAAEYDASTDIHIPVIDLDSDVTTLHLNENVLDTPDTIVGRFTWAENKTLLVGHAGTVFQNLKYLTVGDEIYYDEVWYKVVKMEVKAKAEISMTEILAEAEEETIIIMTCSGQDLGGGDATHRLIVTAVSNG